MRKNKMAATMLSMKLQHVDVLNVDQLEIDDYIELDDNEIVQVLQIETTKDSYILHYIDEYDEDGIVEVSDDASFNWYVLIDEDE
jgi:hypothetical protein